MGLVTCRSPGLPTDSAEEPEDVINWIENPPNLDQLNKEVLHEIYSKVSFVGESLRSIHINLMVFEKQKNSEIIGMASGIKQHLQNASNDILNSGNSGVMFAFWDLHLALEKAIKTLLMQKGSTTYYRHNLNSLFQEAVEEHGVDINYSSLSKLPTSKEAIQYRYGEIQGTTSEYAISIYNIVLSLVASTTKALERKITMNNASFQFQVPPWRK